jgi:hypothetical protein
MTRTRLWTFTFVVGLALGVHLALLSPKVAQTAEDGLRARLATASNALRAQVDLADARLSPRAAASAPELADALKPPADPTLPLPKADEKALRAAAAAAQPVEPDLLIVATEGGAAVSRRGKPAALVDDVKTLPLVKSVLDGGSGGPSFATYGGQWFRVQAAKIPGAPGVVVTGQLFDDKLAAQLRSLVDADVSLLKDDGVLASSLAAAQRTGLLAWAKAPALGWGVLALRLPVAGAAFDGKLPYGAQHYATRAVRQPMESGVMAVLTVPAFGYFGWLGRYQAFYLLGFAGFLLIALVLSLIPGPKLPEPKTVTVEQPVPVVPRSVEEAASRAAATLAGANDPEARQAAPQDVPWGTPTPTPSAPPRIRRSDPELEAMPAQPPAPPPAAVFELHPPEHPVTPPAPPVEDAPPAAEPAKAPDFSFASLLDEAKGAPPTPPPAPISLAQEEPDRTNPGSPSPELLAQSREPEMPFPGDEPTRIEPVSAALLDKMREKDEPAASDWDALPTPPLPAAAPAQSPVDPWSFAEAAGGPVERPDGPPGDQPTTAPIAGAESAARAAFEESNATEAVTEDEAALEPLPEGAAEELEELPADAQSDAVAADGAEEQAAAVEAEAAAQRAAEELAAAEAAQKAAEEQAAAEAAQKAAEEQAAAEAAQQDGANVTLSDFSFTRPAAVDPDEAHFQETFQKFLDLRAELGEPADKVSYDKFAAKLRKNRDDLMARSGGRAIRFAVYAKDGKAAIKASAVK